MAHQQKQRAVYDMYNSDSPSTALGRLMRQEGEGYTSDQSVDNCYDNTGYVYDFYKEVFNRNSIDDQGMPLISFVHFGKGFDNAFWDGLQMIYGDGSNILLKKYTPTALLDVTGHEMTHGVTNYTSNLDYEGESGGLNESMSDCFGIMILQWANKQTVDAASWLIGEGMMVDGHALRSMKDPGTANPFDYQIKNYHDYQDGMAAHQTSGIGNYSFYLACKKVGGYSWQNIGNVWYITNTTRLRHNSGFQEAANNTFDVAGSIFGEGSKEQEAIYDGWQQAGLKAKKPNFTYSSRR